MDFKIPELRFAPSGMTLRLNLMTLPSKSQIVFESHEKLIWFEILEFKSNGIEKNQSPGYPGSLNELLSFRMEKSKF